jgi:hypothetical protein
MKNILTFLLVAIATLLSAQQMTDKHVGIKGSRFAIVPPSADFSPKTMPYTGFENVKEFAKFQFLALDVTTTDYQRMSKAVKGFMEKGKTLISEEDIMASGFPAKHTIVRGLQKKVLAEGVGEMAEFIFHEVKFTFENLEIYAYASFLAKDLDRLGKPMETALKSMVYQKDRVISPYEGLNYTLDPKVTKLKTNLVTPVMAELNVSGTPDGGDEPFYTVTQFDATPENVAALGDGNFIMNERLSSRSIYDKKLQLFENKQFKGYEVTSYDKEIEGKRLLYIVVMRSENKIYSIKGEALYDHDAFLAEFRKITDTIVE